MRREHGYSSGQQGGKAHQRGLMLFQGQGVVQPLSHGCVFSLFALVIPLGHADDGRWRMAEGCAAGPWHSAQKSC